MSLEEWGVIAEIVGALGVVITPVYLAVSATWGFRDEELGRIER